MLKLTEYKLFKPYKPRTPQKMIALFLLVSIGILPLILWGGYFYLKNPQLKNVYLSPLKEIEFRYAYFE